MTFGEPVHENAFKGSRTEIIERESFREVAIDGLSLDNFK